MECEYFHQLTKINDLGPINENTTRGDQKVVRLKVGVQFLKYSDIQFPRERLLMHEAALNYTYK